MEYTVKKLSELAGISGRTLRFYDQIDLLKPNRINSSGYRIYGGKEVDRLQQILFYRNLGLPLEEIKEVLDAPNFDSETALFAHYQQLLEQQQQLNKLIATVEKTLQVKRGMSSMTDKEKFEGFKKELIEKNETQYGDEIRGKYGNQAVEESNQKMAGMSKEKYEAFEKLGNELLEELEVAMNDQNPQGTAGQRVAALHKEWLSFTWGSYSKEAHRGLAEMYVSDPRFTAYYDEKAGDGAASYLRDAIVAYTK
ncbi:MerR family transcriptional regulator [Carnobacterium maltaromaticum]|uniref:MerR family transcriptional regulator n=1 Tax=Carnobacterium maltaromaticum TaxID=2751 RepID=UPI001071C95E|nr:MerR family transcriptional regulator [Carnobacterium maltaromaticum]TFJ76620.1 MerR family transcriptional regulator [Carnobacterium maltaromaticum]TFJ79420.1 MerR family transcriptional regulator [Carnobacterium maltaromaticum]